MTQTPVDLTPPGAGYRHLFGVAYRLLGSVHDAEDAVQEGLVRWEQLGDDGRAAVREPLAWLTRVVVRLCLDELRSARARRERYTGIWLPEPLLGTTALPGVRGGTTRPEDPQDAVTLDESVSIALLTAMEQLTPAERVSLVLHDVFGVPFAEVAEIVGRTPEACRQLASAARRNLRTRPRAEVPGAERELVVAAFARACTDGDVVALAAVLDPTVVSRSDGGDVVHAAKKEIVGAAPVATYLLGVLATGARHGRVFDATIDLVNGRSGIVVREDGRVAGVVDLTVVGQRVTEVAVLVNPEKLPGA